MDGPSRQPDPPGDATTRITPQLLPPGKRPSSVRLAMAAVEPSSTPTSSSPPVVLPPVSEDERTVISNKPPMSSSPWSRFPTGDLGKLLEGKRLGHFQLEEFVGGGGMGVVFRALDTELGRTVAVKVVAGENADQDVLRRFKNEAQSAARLDHPNIARVYYVGHDEGWHYIVFEYIEGPNLRELVEQRGQLPLDEAVHYTLQVAEALEHASRRQVVHRDIKPSNVLVMSDGHVKLVDMGLARLHVQSSSHDLTASGMTLGTFDYISPEQARDPRKSDVRSDLYSLGCTFFYMLAGRAPFSEGNLLQKLLSHTGEAPPDPRQFRPDVPERIVAVIHKLLAKNPDHRYQEPRELIGELLLVCEELQFDHVGQGGKVWLAAPPTPRRWERLVPVLLTALLLVVAIGVIDWQDQRAIGDLPPLRYPLREQPLTKPTTPPVIDVPPALPPVVPVPDPPRRETPVPEPRPVEPPRVVPAESAATETTRILVGPQTEPATPGTLVVPTLAEACRRAMNLPRLEAIELRSDLLREEPFTIAPDNLVIRAAEGFRPVVVFQPTVADESPSSMIGVSGGRLKIERVQFHLDLPEDEPNANGWTLFDLAGVRQMELLDAALTIRSPTTAETYVPSGTTPPDAAPASFVRMRELRPGENRPEKSETPRSGYPVLYLARCVVRGPASLLRVDEAFALKLKWDQGLLASNYRLLEVGGSLHKPGYDQIDLVLNRVTARADRGLVLVRCDRETPYPLGLGAELKHSILSTVADQPLIELWNVPKSPAEAIKELDVRGAVDFLPEQLVLVKVEGERQTHIVDRSGASDATEEPWFHVVQDRSSVQDIMWAQPTDGPADRQTPADFALVPSEQNRAWSVDEQRGIAGCDAKSLPQVIDVPPRPAL